jgi:hypothetical protein
VFSFEELYESRSRDLGLVADVNKAFRTTLDEHGVDRKVTFPAIEAGMKAFATRRYEKPGAETLLPDISPPNPGADITSLEKCPLFSLWADIQAGRAGDESLKEDPAVDGSTSPQQCRKKHQGQRLRNRRSQVRILSGASTGGMDSAQRRGITQAPPNLPQSARIRVWPPEAE